MKGPTPQCVALLLADQAFQQADTGKWCIIGTFDVIHTEHLPARHPPFAVFVSLSDFAGGAFVTSCIRDPEGAVVLAVRGQVPAIPLGSLDLALPYVNVEFKQAGSHTLELSVGDKLVALRSFAVRVGTAETQS